MGSDDRIEHLDFAGDARLRVRSDSLAGLFAAAARGLTGIMTDPDGIEARQRHRVALSAPDLESLLVDWLNELVFLFETRRLLIADCALEVSPAGTLEGELTGEDYAPERHPIEAVIKAVTHHGLSLRQASGGWLAEVVVDL